MARFVRAPRKGGAAVEFALVLPVLLPILFGIMEYSWLFLQQSNLVAATREGLRLGVTVAQTASPNPGSTATTRIRTVLNGYGLDGDGATITPTQTGSSPQELLQLDVTVPYTPLIGFPTTPTPANLTMSATMLLEYQD